MQPRIDPTPLAARPLIELAGVTRTYDTGGGQVRALDDVSLAIAAGEFVAIMGQSGSGKSTMMNLLGCLDRPTSGTYRVNGVDVDTLSDAAVAELRRETFGFVFQRYHLMADLTALDNVAMPAVYAGVGQGARRDRAEAILERLGLAERQDHRPHELSGGQQQRASIGRALMNGGAVVLADEPTGALDSASGREVLGILHELHAHGHTIILITHDPDVAAHADRIVRLADGRVQSDERNPHPRQTTAAATTADSDSTARANTPASSIVAPPRPRMRNPLVVLLESMRMALRSLLHHGLRTTLTMLGIIIGVGSVVAMLAVGAGARQQVLDRIQAMGTDLLSIKRGLAGVRNASSGVVTLVPEDLPQIKAIPGVAYAVPETDRNVVLRHGSNDLWLPATGTGETFPLVRNWPVAEGVFFSDDDVRRHAQVVVLGRAVAEELFPEGREAIGKVVILGNAPFQVLGVLAGKGLGSSGVDLDYQVWLPYTTAATRVFGQRYFRDVTVKVEDEGSMGQVEQAIRTTLIQRHGREDFHIRNMADLIEKRTEARDTFTMLLTAIAVISLVVGGIGVMNIMLVAVSERTREIGIRMAVGARGRDVMVQFLTEAVFVCVLGGLIGIAAGIAAAQYATQLTGWPAIFSWEPVAAAFGSALITGIVFGFIPAMKAARLDPVDALARE